MLPAACSYSDISSIWRIRHARTHNIIISSTDRDRLLDLIDSARLDWRIPRNSLHVLEGELARATIVEPLELPRDIVAMNSTVWLQDLDTQENRAIAARLAA